MAEESQPESEEDWDEINTVSPHRDANGEVTTEFGDKSVSDLLADVDTEDDIAGEDNR